MKDNAEFKKWVSRITDSESDDISVIGTNLLGKPSVEKKTIYNEMTEQQWREAYIKFLIDSTGINKEDATDNCNSGEHDFSEDPEMCAYEEISCWDDDGD